MHTVTKETQISVGGSITTYSKGEHKNLPKEAVEKLTKIGVIESVKKSKKLD